MKKHSEKPVAFFRVCHRKKRTQYLGESLGSTRRCSVIEQAHLTHTHLYEEWEWEIKTSAKAEYGLSKAE